jgi:hypothetical protein
MVDKLLELHRRMLTVVQHEISHEEVADYDSGLSRGPAGQKFDKTKTKAWQRGWAETRE